MIMMPIYKWEKVPTTASLQVTPLSDGIQIVGESTNYPIGGVVHGKEMKRA